MICENCRTEHDGSYGSGRFCSVKCARGFSTKEKRSLINEKVSKKIANTGNKPISKICENCGNDFIVKWKRRNQKTCSKKCGCQLKWKDDNYVRNMKENMVKICSSIEKRKRLRDIGRKGGFGKRGVTKNGTRYESIFEKNCFEYLEYKNIKFEAHKEIPNSAKISDIYLVERDEWIEIDGINREKKKKYIGKNYEYWLEKLELYKKLNLKYKIIYNVEELKKHLGD